MAFDFDAPARQAAEVFDAEQVAVAEGVDFTVAYGLFARIYGYGGIFGYALLHAVAREGSAKKHVRADAFAPQGRPAERQAEAVVVGDFK